MGIGFKHGSSTQALNFKVVGGTEAPKNPKENTIWVNTDAKITGYVFAAAQPEAPTEGMIWIFISVDSTVPFNALKKNDIQVYPMYAKQYIGDAWADVTAMSYQGGAWVSWWNGELFDNGNQYAHVTGGWVQGAYAWASSESSGGGSYKISGTITVTAGNVYDCPGNTSVRTANKIDLTNWNTLTCVGTSSGGSAYFGVATSTGGVPVARATPNGTTTLDISGLVGEHYVLFLARHLASLTATQLFLS